MCSIGWCSFTWEAFATLTTGFFAVAAATTVGVRQISIFRRQIALEEHKVKIDLFGERFAIYEAARAWLSYILAHAAAAPPEIRNEMLGAIDKSRFLFTSNVHTRLQKLY
jgi:hypothetical protein